ncbi:Transporter of the ATP-binding cassette (ABC) [Kickxella alabastrina]|uniref:Transporter of the ATP-binding cassette (ABC) n=1 Tax=Kickxella alabastrina TaxID=61397 RepID=A0ACC1IVC4_9FUNG|nr:Transporter of the ATP-binding cassette (ABC) [Kickxella alabastrina]
MAAAIAARVLYDRDEGEGDIDLVESDGLLSRELPAEQMLGGAYFARNQSRPRLSIRDMLLVVLTLAQVALGHLLFNYDNAASRLSAYEVALWLWAAILCVYLLCRSNTSTPSPSPHLCFVFLAGVFVDFFKARSALLAYSQGKIESFSTIEIAMASIATVLFLASFTEQRRRHGRSSNAPVGESDTHPPVPEGTALISQQLLFSWMDPVIWLGYKRPLEPKDVYDLIPEDRSMRVCAKWQCESRDYVRKHGSDKRGMTYRLFWFFRYQLALQCVWTHVFAVFIFTGPFLLKRILAYMEDQTIYTREQAFWCVAGLLLGVTISTMCQSQALWIGRKIGLQIKAIVIGEVYKKSLRHRNAASEDDASAKDGEGDKNSGEDADKQGESTSMGKITNLMAVDANKISEASSYLHFLYQLPAEIVITVLMLYQLLGLASIAGVCTILLTIPTQWCIVSFWTVIQTQLMKISDKRMSMTNEILQGVRIIKFFAWEPQFEKQVAAIRSGELGVLRKRYLLLTVYIVFIAAVPVFITLTTFVVYTKVMDKQPTASIAFTALALFKTLQEMSKYELSKSTRQAHNGIVSSEQGASYAQIVSATDIGFIDASFSWKSAASASASAKLDLTNPTVLQPLLSSNPEACASNELAGGVQSASNGVFELRGLTVSFLVGKLSIIAGLTGCGKTSLLMALLGEMRLTAGRLMVPGAAFSARATFGKSMSNSFSLQESVAYMAQQAWLLNDTIRGNITFGLPYNDQRYREVVHMCALTRDFEIIDAGDMTEVGERGVALSGGQKQRICLARAVYSPARHIIMDDCLSAVNAHTAKHLYNNCLMAPLMSERTRILVTHAVGLAIKSAAMVVVMQDGRIAAAGTPLKILHSGKLSKETLREADEEKQNTATRAEARSENKGKATDTSGIAIAEAVGDTVDKQFDGACRNSSTNANVKANAAPLDANTQKGKLETDEG